MAGETLHAPRERLRQTTLTMHHAISSLVEELEAVDWYQQRADDCQNVALREILRHNMREEIEHASMILEWMRRNSADWDGELRTYLFTEGDITAAEEEERTGQGEAAAGNAAEPAGDAAAEAEGDGPAARPAEARPAPSIGSLKD